MDQEKPNAKENKDKGRGCGRVWGRCGGHHNKPVRMSTKCTCGRHVTGTCNTVPNCPGKNFVC